MVRLGARLGRIRVTAAIAAAVLFAVSGPAVQVAQAAGQGVKAFLEQLDPKRRQEFEDYLSAQAVHEFALDAYWRQVTDKRALRRAKRRRGEPLTARDYVRTFPPEYKGPQLAPGLAKRWQDYQAAHPAPRKRRTIPAVADILANARKYYGFVPQRIPEREFKRRYAREALALGLTKEQVLRIYALETGGQGTAGMQAGINPLTGQGKPISTALGYAQLLHANSVDEVDNHGEEFIARLRRMAAASGHDPAKVREIEHKIAVLRRMIVNARAVPDTWDAHVAYANTPKGMAIHALNLDGDIGPWLQTVKLAGLRKMAARAGRPDLSGSEIELMNLAGPGTGLEMMQPAGLEAPAPNFFTRTAYARNPVVRGRTSAELLKELDRRMDAALGKPGAREFAAAFDEVLGERQAFR